LYHQRSRENIASGFKHPHFTAGYAVDGMVLALAIGIPGLNPFGRKTRIEWLILRFGVFGAQSALKTQVLLLLHSLKGVVGGGQKHFSDRSLGRSGI
jgi:hypothetical protein